MLTQLSESMNKKRFYAGLFTLIAALIASTTAWNPTRADDNTITLLQRLGKAPAKLQWDDPTGQKWDFPSESNEQWTVVCFLNFACPISNRSVASLNELSNAYKGRDVRFLGVVCQSLSADELKAKKDAFRIEFPLFLDPDLNIAKQLVASGTPQVFLFDRKQQLQYFGAINDQYIDRTTRAITVDHEFLKDAIETSLDGNVPLLQHTDVVGCLFNLQSEIPKSIGAITYHEHIEPILQAKCQTCHHPNDVAPFSLLTYEDAISWADDIKEFVVGRKMPPWPLTGGVAMKNDISLSAEQITLISDWVDAGAPKGDPSKAPPPKEFKPRDEWENQSTPDMVFQIPAPFHLGPDGPDHYRTFVIPIGNKEPLYVNKVQFIPGNRKIVHHTLMFYDGTGMFLDAQKRLGKEKYLTSQDEDYGPGYESGMGLGFIPSPNITKNKDNPGKGLGGWVPGADSMIDPDNSSHLIPPDSSILLQVHYHRTGKREIDESTRLGVWLSKTPPAQHANAFLVDTAMRMIPKGNGHFKSVGKRVIEDDVTLWLLFPHMHQIGKEFRAWYIDPDSKKKELLVELSHWDFNWQTLYLLKDPIRLKKGTTLVVECIWDNSTSNPFNPNKPPKNVFLGEDAIDEMGFAIFGVVQDELPKTTDYVRYLEKLIEAKALQKLVGEK